MGNTGLTNSGQSHSKWSTAAVLTLPVLIGSLTMSSSVFGLAVREIGLPTIAIGTFVGLYTRTTLSRFTKSALAALGFLWMGLFDLVHGLAHADAATGVGLMEGYSLWALVGASFFLAGSAWRKGLKRAHLLSRTPTALALTTIGATVLPFALPLLFGNPQESGLWVEWVRGVAIAAFLASVVIRWPYAKKYGEPVTIGLLISGIFGAAAIILEAGWALTAEQAASIQAFSVAMITVPPLIGFVANDVSELRESTHARLRITMLVLLVFLLLLCAALNATFDGGGIGRSRLVIVAILLTTSTGVFVVTAANRDVIRRVSDLFKSTMAFAAGDYNVRIETSGNDELAKLGKAFNGLAERISAQHDELQMLARVMEGSSEPLALVDDAHRIAFVNAAFAQTIGWQRLEMVGRPFERLFDHTPNTDAAVDMWRLSDERGQWSGEVFLRRRNEEPLDFAVTVNEVRRGRARYVVVLRDLTVIREMEKERTVYLRHLIKIGRLTRLMVDNLSSEEIQEQAVNHLKDDFGADSRIWNLEETRSGRHLVLGADSLRPHMRGEIVKRSVDGGLVGRVIKEGEPIVCLEPDQHDSIFATSGEELCLLGPQAAFPLEVNGRLAGVLELALADQGHQRSMDAFLLMARILSGTLSHAALYRQTRTQASSLEELGRDRELALQRLELKTAELEAANDKLVESGRTKDLFLSTASHELRTPVSAVLGFLRLILDGLASTPDEEKEFLVEAHGCAEHLLALINDILDVARIEAGRLEMVRTDVNVAGVVDDVLKLSGAKTQDKNIEIDVEIESEVTAYGDAHRLKQVFINLIGNAVKFTEEGRILVRAEARPELGHVRVSVRDTGIGMTPESTQNIFEAFVQADASDTRAYGGSGLGLSITRQLVTMMGGSLTLQSEGLGLGTEAAFTLPLAREALDPHWLPPTPARTSRGRVLLVGHDLAFWRKTSQAFADANYAVALVDTADQALERARKVLPQVVISGFTLIHESDAELQTGLDLAGALLEEEGIQNAEFLLVTGNESPALEIEEELKHFHGVALIQRPIDPEDLPFLIGQGTDSAPQPTAST